jgi:hypothetical protein
MKKKINEKLSEVFDVDPIEITDDTKLKENELIVVDTRNAVETDTDIARQNIKDLIAKGKSAVDELAVVAKDSQHPRAYEVMATLIKSMSDLNKDLLELQKRKRDLMVTKDERPSGGDMNVDKAIFVGSTAELMKFLNKNK